MPLKSEKIVKTEIKIVVILSIFLFLITTPPITQKYDFIISYRAVFVKKREYTKNSKTSHFLACNHHFSHFISKFKTSKKRSIPFTKKMSKTSPFCQHTLAYKKPPKVFHAKATPPQSVHITNDELLRSYTSSPLFISTSVLKLINALS